MVLMYKYKYLTALSFSFRVLCLCAGLWGCAGPVDPTSESVYNASEVVDIDTTDISLMNTAVTSDGWTVFALISSCKVVVYDLKLGSRDTIPLSAAHGSVTWGGSLALDTSNALLMIMDKTSSVVSVMNWRTKQVVTEVTNVARAFISPNGESLLVQSTDGTTIKKINIMAKSEETLAMPLAKSASDLMLGVDWERQGIVMYTSYPLTTHIQSFDGSTVLQTITWPSDITQGLFACARGGAWATLNYGGKNGESAGMVSYDLRTGQQLGKLGADDAGSYPGNMILLSARRAYISAQRTTSPTLEPAIHDVANGAALQTLSLHPDAERTARAWSVSQHDRYVTAFLVKAPASTGVIRMWRVR